MEKYVEYVEKHRQLILDALDYIWKNPEIGYKEWKTHRYLAEAFEKLGYELKLAGNIPGFTAEVDTGRPGPTGHRPAVARSHSCHSQGSVEHLLLSGVGRARLPHLGMLFTHGQRSDVLAQLSFRPHRRVPVGRAPCPVPHQASLCRRDYAHLQVGQTHSQPMDATSRWCQGQHYSHSECGGSHFKEVIL